MDDLVLAFDTAGQACSLALVSRTDGPLFSQIEARARGHAAALPALAQVALQSVPRERIRAIAVTRGPGGFTGIRVGLAYARAFGVARRLPVFGVSVFAALRARVGQQVPCLIDTRRGDFFYDRPTAQALALPELANPETFGLLPAQALIGKRLQALAGSIWQTDTIQGLAGLPPPPALESGWIEPCPIALAQLALEALATDTAPTRAALSPLYGRAPSIG